MKQVITLAGEVPFEIMKGCLMVNAAGKQFRVIRRLTTNSVEVGPYRWYHKLWNRVTHLSKWEVLQVVLFVAGLAVGNLLYRWATQ